MRNDGKYTIYVLQAQSTDKKDKPHRWFGASFDHFGTPRGFSANDPCWQKTGIHGTFDEGEGIAAAQLMSQQHVEYNWRLMRMEVSQEHFEVVTFSAKAPGQKPPDGYPVTNQMRQRYDAIRDSRERR